MFDVDPALLDMLYRGVTEPGAFSDALLAMTRVFDCTSAALVSFDPLAPDTNLALSEGVIQENIKLYVNEFAAIDPAPATFARLPAGTASATNRLFTTEELRKIVFFQEFLVPIGLVETLGGTLFADKDRFALIGLQRSNDRRDFDDDDIATLEHLMPHIRRALQLRRVFEHRTILASGLQAAIERLHAGVMLLNSKGVALYANPAMRAMAQRGDGFKLDRENRPFPIDLTARRHLEQLLARGAAGGTFVIPRTEPGTHYTGIVTPVPPAFNDVVWDRRGRGEMLVIIHDPDARSAGTEDILQQGLHLTKAAAHLVAALAADDDLQSFADREGVTIHTARFHLRTALARTGATTQAELVRIAVRLLRDVAMRS